MALALFLVNDDQFIVHVGELSQKGFDQMRRTVQKYWPVSVQHDLNRFVGLYLDERFYYLFAKFLPQSDYLLSLVFTPKTPRVRIRQDMTDVMRRVLQMIRTQIRDEGEGLEQSLQFILKPYPAPGLQGQSPSQLARVEPEDWNQRTKEEAVPEQIFPTPPDQIPEWRTVPGTTSLMDGPPSVRGHMDAASPAEWVPLEELFTRDKIASKTAENRSEEKPVFQGSPQSDPVERTSRGSPGDWQPLEEALQPEPDLVELFHEDFELQKDPASPVEYHLPADQPAVGTVDLDSKFSEEATRPTALEQEGGFDQIKLSDITFYLVPSLDRHYLLGELAQRLRSWFPGICETYGWQLDFLSVRPDYLKWRLHDFPDALIYEMLEVVRKRTSERIFRVFPNLRTGNPGEDFWSPGYLVDRKNQDFSTQVLIAYVDPNRRS